MNCRDTAEHAPRCGWRLLQHGSDASKNIHAPKEGQRIRFRAEAFNAFNNVNFTNPSLALTAPLTFGEFQQTTPPREMQFALRYEF